MSLLPALAAALALAAPQDPLPELTDEQLNDLVCVAAYAMAAGQDPSQASVVAPGLFFYLGRLEGRDPEVDWFQRLAQRAQVWSLGILSGARPGCDAVMAQRATSLMETGSGLVESE